VKDSTMRTEGMSRHPCGPGERRADDDAAEEDGDDGE